MKTELTLHPAQAALLRELLFKPEARFSELNVTDLTNDHFNFHVRTLVEMALIEKQPHNRYRLTDRGKEFANRFDSDGTYSTQVERQAKVGVAISCVKEEKSVTKYLIQQRLKQPFYGFYGFMTGKIRWGESVYDAAKRELEEETGLSATLTLVGVKHKTDTSVTNKLLEDKYFFVFRGDNVQGQLIESFEGGRNIWLTKEEIAQLPEVFHDLPEGLALVDSNNLTFMEQKFTVEKY